MSERSDDVIAKLAEVWASITELCASVGGDEWDRPTDCPGWTVRDQLSHLAGTESALAGRPAGEHTAERAEWVRNDLGAFNENIVDSRRALPGEAVLAEFAEVTRQRLDQLRAMTDEEFAADSWTPVGPGSYLDFMDIRVLDCYVHEQDIRRALDRPGHAAGPAVEHTLDLMLRAVPKALAKGAGAGEGTSVVVELTGPVRRRRGARVSGGRGEPVDPAGPGAGSATATVALASTDFLALASGRRRPETMPVRVEGDQRLGHAVAAGLYGQTP